MSYEVASRYTPHQPSGVFQTTNCDKTLGADVPPQGFYTDNMNPPNDYAQHAPDSQPPRTPSGNTSSWQPSAPRPWAPVNNSSVQYDGDDAQAPYNSQMQNYQAWAHHWQNYYAQYYQYYSSQAAPAPFSRQPHAFAYNGVQSTPYQWASPLPWNLATGDLSGQPQNWPHPGSALNFSPGASLNQNGTQASQSTNAWLNPLAIPYRPTTTCKASLKAEAKLKKYGHLGLVRPYKSRDWRINKACRTPAVLTPDVQVIPQVTPRKGKDPKIMLPAPQPAPEYLAVAAEEPSVQVSPDSMLVILDLNGTLLYRPNARKQPTRIIARPFLKQFLRYLFQNFRVMVWSSARPENVQKMVGNVLDDDLQQLLVGIWARDTLGLGEKHYSLNVQCYKDLVRVWRDETVQRQIPGYENGKRWDQRNTILIDDSMLKANAQPHNLVEIPEFTGTNEQMQGDVLKEVAGYLEELRTQQNISSFIKKTPFTSGSHWAYAWEDDNANGGLLQEKISLKPDHAKVKR